MKKKMKWLGLQRKLEKLIHEPKKNSLNTKLTTTTTMKNCSFVSVNLIKFCFYLLIFRQKSGWNSLRGFCLKFFKNYAWNPSRIQRQNLSELRLKFWGNSVLNMRKFHCNFKRIPSGVSREFQTEFYQNSRRNTLGATNRILSQHLKEFLLNFWRTTLNSRQNSLRNLY